jgi:hypothetical protein
VLSNAATEGSFLSAIWHALAVSKCKTAVWQGYASLQLRVAICKTTVRPPEAKIFFAARRLTATER